MAKIDITRTELVWPGKYNDDGKLRETPRVQLPFQVIETVNESRATREAQGVGTQSGLFDVYEGKEGDTFEDGWRNKLIWGDNLLVLGSLLEKFAGKIDLIYIDPPFATGADFSLEATVGDSDLELAKVPTALEELAYRDTWGDGAASYLQMISSRLSLLRACLSPSGSIIVHCDFRLVHHLGALLDDLFGQGDRGHAKDQAGFRNEIVWQYGLGGSSPKCYPKKHDVLLWYSKGSAWKFDPPLVPAKSQRMKGQLKKCPDCWDIPSINNMADERTGYPTQKPEALLERVVRAHSQPGDLVADFFCGSGTTMVAAEKLGRRWIGCDLGRWAINVTRKRLLGIEGCKPFEVLNLGRYERQYWQGESFGQQTESRISEGALYGYLAFVLRLYGARPIPGSPNLHGKKGNAMVHVGAVDAPVTIDEVNHALEECARLRQEELHVLGWEWEMGVAGGNETGGLMQREAQTRGINLKLLQIPREVMERQVAEEGGVRFFELAFLEAEIERTEARTVRVVLGDFVIPNSDLIPNDVRGKVTKWSDWIDYWAVDWDFQRDTFMQGWVTFRTRKNRALDLQSEPHAYERPGKYTVLIKVVDIFGNDTSQALDVEVE